MLPGAVSGFRVDTVDIIESASSKQASVSPALDELFSSASDSLRYDLDPEVRTASSFIVLAAHQLEQMYRPPLAARVNAARSVRTISRGL